jgi:hypothetical protein
MDSMSASRRIRSALGLCMTLAIVGALAPPSIAASGGDLLYVADYSSNKVYVFSYPQGVLVGTLTGFSGPWGVCADGSGNVWITNRATPSIVEYARGASKPTKTLGDSDGYPVACSVDPSTGNLAVANIAAKGGSGSVLVFHDASGTPTKYEISSLYYYDAAGYNADGDLFVDGTAHSGSFHLAELPSGASSFEDMTFDENIAYPVGLQAGDKFLALGKAVLGSTSHTTIYHVELDGQTGKVVGQSTVDGAASGYQISGSTLIASVGADVYFYDYPKGGAPTKKLTGFQSPIGLALSP